MPIEPMPASRVHASGLRSCRAASASVRSRRSCRQLLDVTAAELPVDPPHAQVEQLHGHAALADVGADQVGTVGSRCDERDGAPALRRDGAHALDEPFLDRLGDQVRGRGEGQSAVAGDRRTGSRRRAPRG